MIIAEALELAMQMGRDCRQRRFAQCVTRQRHHLLTISMREVRVDYCQHCGCLLVDGLVVNPPLTPDRNRLIRVGSAGSLHPSAPTGCSQVDGN